MTSKTNSHCRSRPSSEHRRLRALLLSLVFALAGPFAGVPGAAQDFGQVISPVLTIDRERLYRESAFGKRIAAALEQERLRLEKETSDIEAALVAEEQALTEAKANTEPAAFRALADAFDEKVQTLRDDRVAAEQALVRQIEAAQSAFFERVTPVLAGIMHDADASVLLDRRSVILSTLQIDITQRAIVRIDAEIGAGEGLDVPGVPQTGAPATLPPATATPDTPALSDPAVPPADPSGN